MKYGKAWSIVGTIYRATPVDVAYGATGKEGVHDPIVFLLDGTIKRHRTLTATGGTVETIITKSEKVNLTAMD